MGKKRKTVWIVVFLLHLPLLFLINSGSSGAATLAKDAWMYDGETAVVNDIAFKLRHDSFYSNYSYIECDINLTKIYNGTCADFNAVRICVNHTIFDAAKAEDKVNVKFFLLKPEIAVSRIISSSTPFLMDEVQVTVNINNTGDIAATDFNFTDIYPSEVEFTSVDGPSVSDNVVYWRGRIQKEAANGVTLKYKFRMNKKIEHQLKGEYTYFDNEKILRKYTDVFELKPKHLITLTKSAAYLNTYIGQNNNLTINLTKDYLNSSIDVNLTITIPDNVGVDSYAGDLKKISENKYQWSGTMYNTSRGFILYLYGKRIGASDVRLDLFYEDPLDRKTNRRTYTDEQFQNIELIGKDIILSTTLAEGETLESFQGKNFTAYVVNTNKGAYLADVRVRIFVNLSENSSKPFIIEKNISRMSANQQADFKFNLTAPEIKADASTKFNITASYFTQYGDNATVVLEKTLQLKSIKDLTITSAAGKAVLEEGEKTTVSVSVKNPRLIDLPDVRVFDKSNFSVTKGNPYKAVEFLRADKTADFYTYEIIAPKVRQSTDFEINTTASYQQAGRNYTYSKITKITVRPKSLDMAAARTYSSNTPFQGQSLDVNYVLTNNDVESAKDFYIIFPLQQETDLIGGRTYYIASLDPGEKVTLNKLYNIRGKFNKSVNMEPAFIYYRDLDGNVFTFNSSKETLVFKYSYLDTPVLVLHKNTSSNAGPSFPVEIKIENKGVKIAENVLVKDGEKEWAASLSPGQTKTFSYIKSLPPGTYTLDKTTARYTYDGLNYTTASPAPVVTVTKDVIVVSEEKNKTNETTVIDVVKDTLANTETGMQVSENLEKTLESSKSFFTKVKEFFSSLAFWRHLKAEPETNELNESDLTPAAAEG